MSILPITNIINVSITETPVGIGVKNVNSLGLFTTEQPGNFDPYGIYLSASQVAADYGSGSVTAAMANAIFAQSPNILAGDGQLVIMPLISSVSATPGKFVTPDISANLASFQAVTSGDLKITLGTTAYNLSGLNFSQAASLSDIAAIIQSAIPNCQITATTTQITFQNNKVGTAASVALATYAGGGTDLIGSNYLKVSTGTTTAGVNSSGETLSAAIARTMGQVAYVGVITNLNLEDAAIVTAASFIQGEDMMFLHHVSSTVDIAGVGTTIQQASDHKTRILLYTGTQANANLMKSAYAGRLFSVDFTGTDTSQTMNLKQLATITPDTAITQTLYNAAETAGVNLYVSYDGYPAVFSTGGNNYDDNVYSDLALKFALQTNGFNYLAQTNTKVPQTEQDMYGLKNAYAQIMNQFINNGCGAPGQWTSSETFGNQQKFLQNITDFGYYIYSLPVALQTSAARASRAAPLVQIAFKRAGAIHTSNVIVLVNA